MNMNSQPVIDTTQEVVEVVESIKDINPDAPPINHFGNVTVITESVPTPKMESVHEVYYNPDTDDRIPGVVKLITAVAIVAFAYLVYKFKMS